MVFKVLPTHIDAEFHGESISDGFRAIRVRKVGQKLKKPGGIAKLDSQVTLLQNLSRTTPHRTVVRARGNPSKGTLTTFFLQSALFWAAG